MSPIKYIILLVFISGCCAFSGSEYKGAVAYNFDGTHFLNQDTSFDRGTLDLFKWYFLRDAPLWCNWYDIEQKKVKEQRVDGKRLVVTFVNHATVLIQTEGLNILTDPIWSERGSPVSFLGPLRKKEPGIKFEDLPKIDIVLVSHNHYDHMDIPTLKRLRDRFNPLFVVPLGNKEFMKDNDFENVIEMNWWDKYKVNDFVNINFVPARHFSGRGICDMMRTLWGGYVIQTDGGDIYFAGDTGYGRHFKQIHDRFGKMRFSILPLGPNKPRWFMYAYHISPRGAVAAHKILESNLSMGMHFGTFSLGDDTYDDAINKLQSEKKSQNVSDSKLITLENGESVEVPEINLNK